MDDRLRLAAPEQPEPQMLFDQLESHFNIPPPGIGFGDHGERELLRVAHIGEVAIEDRPPAILDQSHGMLGPIRAVLAEPDQGIERLPVLVEGVEQFVAAVRGQPTEPVVPGVSKVVKPAEAEVAEIGEDQGGGGELGDEGAGVPSLVLMGIIGELETLPLLPTEIKDAAQGAG
jgi:hypothetical protein